MQAADVNTWYDSPILSPMYVVVSTLSNGNVYTKVVEYNLRPEYWPSNLSHGYLLLYFCYPLFVAFRVP